MPDRFQEFIFFSSGHGNKIPVLHFNLSSITFNITFDVIEIDDVWVMSSEKYVSWQYILEFF